MSKWVAETKLVMKWKVPDANGPGLLTMPNIPLPLHSLAPRKIMGATEWTKARTACYEACDRHCEVCGVECSKGKMDAHELYSYNYKKREAKFVRLVGLCKTCHSGIHSGRAITCYANHAPLWTKDVMLKQAEHVCSLVHRHNLSHPDDEPLRLYETYLDWLEEPSLRDDLTAIFEQHNIKFWTAQNRSEWENDWTGWKLIYNGTEYYGLYESREDWEQKMAEVNRQTDKANLFAGSEFDMLRAMGE